MKTTEPNFTPGRPGKANAPFPINRYAALFPLPEPIVEEMAADIKANGLAHPIEIYRNEVVDGRCRLAACQLAGVTPTYKEVEIEGGDAGVVAYIASVNLKRRHLTVQERAEIAAKMANLQRGGDGSNQYAKGSNDPLAKPGVTIEQAAKAMGVGTASVKRARARLNPKPKPAPAQKAEPKTAEQTPPPPKPEPTATADDAVAAVRATTADPVASRDDSVIRQQFVDYEMRARRQLEQSYKEAMTALDGRGFKKIGAAINQYIKAEWEYAIDKHAEAKFRASVGKRLKDLARRERKVEEEARVLYDRIDKYGGTTVERFKVDDLRRVRSCLHPDKPERSKEQLETAFNIIDGLFEIKELRGKKLVRIRAWP